MLTIIVEDLVVPDSWVEKHEAAYIKEVAEKNINKHDEGEIDIFLLDYFTRNPITEGIMKERITLDVDKIISVEAVDPKACPLPERIVPECWKTQIVYGQ